MKNYFLCPSAVAVALLTSAIFGAATGIPAPQTPPTPQTPSAPEARPDRHLHIYPAPTNLQVLPKDLSGQQVHEIMEEWTTDLGAHCTTCHVTDPKAPPRANGQPSLDFALDNKSQKKTARLMYTLEQDIRDNYMSKIDNVGVPVSCATCHRGHLSPPPFSPPPKQTMDMAPPAAAAPPATPPQ